MQFNKSLMTATLLAAASLTAVSASAAGTATGKFNVLLQVDSVCTVNAATGTQDIDFGTVEAGVAPTANVTSATALSVKCSKDAPYVVTLKPSNGNTDGLGVMAGPDTDTVGYQLNSNAAGTDVWGSTGVLGEPGNSVSGTGLGTTVAIKLPVYATVTTSTDVTVGSYKDLVNVAVIY